jgi:outer membrane protein assembly factor BamD (BamD/ComL family)
MANASASPVWSVRARLLAVAVAFALLGPGCKTWSDFKSRTNTIRTALFETGYDDPKAQEKLADAERQFGEGDYAKAQTGFKNLADNQLNPADLAERARFMQAECRYKRGQYPEAVDTYHKLLMDFPTGAHRRDSCVRMYQIADEWLEDFRKELERRKDEHGVLTWRPEWKNPFDKKSVWIGQEGRTLEALDHVWTHDMTGPHADKALFWCGYINFIRGNFNEADHYFSTLAEMHKESKLRPQAMAYAVLAKNNSTGGAVYDGRKCAEALHLIHVAEATVPELTQDPEMARKLNRARDAIRHQQAEKDFRTAEYYERTGHPGSAVFCYELVRRRYAGTRYSDTATERKEHILASMKAGTPLPGIDPFAKLEAKWKELFAKDAPQAYEEREPPRPDPKLVPAGGLPLGANPASPYPPGP